MKKLFYILLLAIIAAGVASPVYAQEGYPVEDRCSDYYWMGVSPADCVAYYEGLLPDDEMKCSDSYWEGVTPSDCVAYYESALDDTGNSAVIVRDTTVDVPAGGEGPNAAVVIAISFAALLGIAFYLTYKAFWKHR